MNLSRLDDAEREKLRAKVLKAIPSWYSPWIHLAFPSLFGLGVITTCAILCEGVTWWQLLTIPVMFLLSNIGEWHAHKNVLHLRQRFLELLYDRHTPLHHMVYLTEDMEVRSSREWRLVLIPAYGIVLIALVNAPIAAALWTLWDRNVALLFLATAVGYVLTYEWLHLAFHMPRTTFVGRLELIDTLRRHHAIHHAPERMQKWNFNVTFPIWDWVKGTVWKAERSERT